MDAWLEANPEYAEQLGAMPGGVAAMPKPPPRRRRRRRGTLGLTPEEARELSRQIMSYAHSIHDRQDWPDDEAGLRRWNHAVGDTVRRQWNYWTRYRQLSPEVQQHVPRPRRPTKGAELPDERNERGYWRCRRNHQRPATRAAWDETRDDYREAYDTYVQQQCGAPGPAAQQLKQSRRRQSDRQRDRRHQRRQQREQLQRDEHIDTRPLPVGRLSAQWRGVL